MRIWKAGVAGGKVLQKGRGRQIWTQAHLDQLTALAQRGASAKQIGLELGRSALSVRVKASRLGIALVGHEIKQGARRQARREGTVALAELGSTRRRATVKVTVDFDLSSLTRTERRALAERLAELAAAEGETARAPKVSEHAIHGGREPSEAVGAQGLDPELEAAVEQVEWEEMGRIARDAAVTFGRGLREEMAAREAIDRRREEFRERCIAKVRAMESRRVALDHVEWELPEASNPFHEYDAAYADELAWARSVHWRAVEAIEAAVQAVVGPRPYRRPPSDRLAGVRHTIHARNAALEEERDRKRERVQGG